MFTLVTWSGTLTPTRRTIEGERTQNLTKTIPSAEEDGLQDNLTSNGTKIITILNPITKKTSNGDLHLD